MVNKQTNTQTNTCLDKTTNLLKGNDTKNLRMYLVTPDDVEEKYKYTLQFIQNTKHKLIYLL